MSRLIREIIDQGAVEFAAVPAVKWLEKKEIREIGYPQLCSDVTALRRGLAAAGFSDSHIALLGGTSLAWVEGYLAVVTGRNAAIPLDAGLPAEELTELVNRSDAAGLFLDAKFEPMLPAFLASCPRLKTVWLMNGGAPCDDARVGSFEALKQTGEQNGTADDPLPERDALAMIIFTSGTTGKSKGVMLTQSNLAENVEAMSFHTVPGVVMLNVLPVHHAFCLVMDWLRGFNHGATVCINDSMMHMLRNMALFRPHSMLMVPLMIETIYKRLMKADPSLPKEEVAKAVFGGRLKYVFTGGAHLETFYVDKLAEYGIVVLEGYGMSECSPVISANTPVAYRKGSVGKPLPNVELAFSDEGEVLVRGSSVMKEYYKMPRETSEAIRDGWLHTGDKGYLDEDGFLYLNGRLKNLIILSNGENVSPEELENKLGLWELVGEVVVTGADNGLCAIIYPDQDESAGMTEDELRAALQIKLDEFNRTQPGYRHITQLRLRKNPFHKSSTRKIIRQEIDIDEP